MLDTPTTPANAKREVRASVRARRESVHEDLRLTNDAEISRVLLSYIATLRPAATICAFVPSLGEAGGPDLPSALHHAGVRVLLPVTGEPGPLDWAEFDSATDLSPGRFGIPEPQGPALGAGVIAEADAVLVPAVAVDLHGRRLGRGGGYYDQTLGGVRPGAELVCVLDAGDVLPSVPVEPHDLRVDAVITEEGLHRFPR
ncbi:5-formyltetrahydrofolate cyclo-ligase [Dietzia sp.]|uniref:5-formyltetrahydrofolate cyclo-ligase n=1 Tax=Dietzia sp. TaxID=1871616 RepID=UPI002FDB17A7